MAGDPLTAIMSSGGGSFGNAFGSAFGGAMGDFAGSIFGNRTVNNGWQNTQGTQLLSGTASQTGVKTSRKVLDQNAINQLIYSVLSSDQGLAGLATGENMSGGGRSSTKALMAQDLITKLVGELANVTAPTIDTMNQSETQKSQQTVTSNTQQQASSKKKSSVICTELHRQGYLESEEYIQGQKQFYLVSPYIVSGYQWWALPIVERMKTNKDLCEKFLPWIKDYYAHVFSKKRTLRSCLILYVGKPLAYVVGLILAAKEVKSCPI